MKKKLDDVQFIQPFPLISSSSSSWIKWIFNTIKMHDFIIYWKLTCLIHKAYNMFAYIQIFFVVFNYNECNS